MDSLLERTVKEGRPTRAYMVSLSRASRLVGDPGAELGSGGKGLPRLLDGLQSRA